MGQWEDPDSIIDFSCEGAADRQQAIMELVDVFPEEDSLHVLSKEAEQRAATELGETEETRSTALTKLKEALEASVSDPGTKAAPVLKDCSDLMADDFLLKFLRARNFDVGHAHQLVLNYFLFQQNHPFLFTDLNSDAVSPMLDTGIFAVLPKRDRQGRVVFLFFPARHHLSEIPFDHMLRACVFLLERAVRSAETQVNGIVLMEDFSGFTLRQALASKARDLKNLVTLAQVGIFPVPR